MELIISPVVIVVFTNLAKLQGYIFHRLRWTQQAELTNLMACQKTILFIAMLQFDISLMIGISVTLDHV